MVNKKLEVKRLLIYLVTVFAFAFLPLVFWKPFGESRTFYYIVGMIFCCSPAFANILARKLTNEGFNDMKLHLNLRGHFRWYLVAFFVPIIVTFSGTIFVSIVHNKPIIAEGVSLLDIATTIFMLGSQAAVFSLIGVGEELGWRGYMNDKLEALFGTLGACLIGGVIWGFWHVPSDIAVYLNGFGTSSELLYGLVERSILPICLGIFLMWLTKKTNSVWPAVIGHTTYNASLNAGLMFFGEAEGRMESSVSNWTLFIPFVVMGVLFLLMMRKKTD